MNVTPQSTNRQENNQSQQVEQCSVMAPGEEKKKYIDYININLSYLLFFSFHPW